MCVSVCERHQNFIFHTKHMSPVCAYMFNFGEKSFYNKNVPICAYP